MVSDNELFDTISGTHSVLTEFSNESFTMNAQHGCRSAQVCSWESSTRRIWSRSKSSNVTHPWARAAAWACSF